jgi:hypothetical protein
MALTYEDIYGNENRREFQRAARALLYGTYDFLFENPQPVDYVSEDLIPAELDILPNYPNPFNNQTRIRYTLPAGREVAIRFYNASGLLVDQVEQGFQNRGYHEYVWTAPNLSSGMYFIKITAGQSAGIHKLLLVQ